MVRDGGKSVDQLQKEQGTIKKGDVILKDY